MKKIFFLLICSIQCIYAQDFDKYFSQGALRIDFFLFGSAQKTNASIHKLKKEPFFGGSKKNFLYPNYGTFQIQIKDAKTQKIIFSKGFNPLFSEWQSTIETKQKNKIFENVIQIPLPKDDIIFEILERDYNGVFQLVMSENISPYNHHIINETPTQYPVKKLFVNNPPEKAIDLVIVAEGYTQSQMQKFVNDAKRLTDYMFTIPPFDKYKDKFNIYLIESPSEETGTDINGRYVYNNTILNSHFYTFDSERYLTIPSLFKLADITANVPYDQIYVLVNTDIYGGGGFYNAINLVSSDNYLSDKVFVHEFGHGFVGLADEYYNDSAGMEISQNLKIEPWEANITTLADFSSKWANMVKKKIPIPTPRIDKYENEIGAFEGGGYLLKGIYSPVQNCRMKSNEAKGFCPVCSKAIKQTIDFQTQ